MQIYLNNIDSKAIPSTKPSIYQEKKSSNNVIVTLFLKNPITKGAVDEINGFFHSNLVTIENNKMVIDAVVLKYIVKAKIVSMLDSVAPNIIRNSSALNMILEVTVDGILSLPLQLFYNISTSNNLPVVLKGEFLEVSKEQRVYDLEESIHTVLTSLGAQIVESIIINGFNFALEISHLTLTHIHRLPTSNSSLITNITSIVANSAIESLDIGIQQVQLKVSQKLPLNATL